MTIRRYRPMALVLLVLHLTGCQSWRPTVVGPRQLIEEEQPSSVRVTRSDSAQLVVNGPAIQGNAIVGLMQDSTQVRVDLEEVQAVEVRRVSAGRTFAAVVAAGAAAVGVAVVIILASFPRCEPGGSTGPCR